ncbi:MAG: pantetheine-phosphate adenylyltransferase [Chloroflexi bacterium]|nr:pantetheine-phosphate adenylyltransferase [Chloroflexota bacterium]
MTQASRRPAVAIYPGSFDPVHFGHIDVVRRAAAIFDRVIVAVYDRPAKNVLFTTEERLTLVRAAVDDMTGVEVAPYVGLTVDYAVQRGARAIIRGLRAAPDFELEFQLALMNRHLSPQIEALFLMTSLEHAHLSSSLIKEVAFLGGQLDGLVPDHVAKALKEKRELP